MKPIILDQYTAARAYFLCVIGLLFFESLFHLLPYLLALQKRGRAFSKASASHSKIYIFFHMLLSLPSPLPFITNYGILDLLRLGVFVGLNILWGWNNNEYTTDFKLYGWLTIANGGLGLLLASRSNLFTYIARIPGPTLLLYHRWIGLATVVHATIHFAFNTRHYIRTSQLAISYMNTRIQIGIMAWISLCLIAITSMNFIRRRWFEVFYYSHGFFLIFVVGALIHATKGPEFLLPGLGLWVIDRAIRFAYNFRKVEVRSVTQYPGDLTKFKIEGVKISHPRQVAWIQLPGVSFRNWHPFTLASAPGDKVTVVAMRGLGSFTKNVHFIHALSNEVTTEGQGSSGGDMPAPAGMVKMRVDGPYGIGHIQWSRQQVTVLIAGGIGITPGISIASHVINTAMLSPDSNTEQRHIHILWVIKDHRHAQWFEEELTHLRSLVANPDVRVTLDVTIHVTGGSVSRMDGPGAMEAYGMEELYKYAGPGDVVQGRPDILAWISNVKSKIYGLDAAVNICGPRSLVDEARTVVAKLSGDGTVFHVEVEEFEL